MILDLKKFINRKNPLFQFGLYLLCFSFISLFDLISFTKSPFLVWEYIFRLFGSILLAFTFYFISSKKLAYIHTNPINFLITSLIIFLLIHPTEHVLLLFITIFFAWTGKFIKNKSHQPVFNPAALGIFLTYLFTLCLNQVGLLQETLLLSWWGADMQQKFAEGNSILQIALPVILLGGFMYFTDRFKRSVYSATFFLTYIVLSGGAYYISHTNISETIRFANTAFFNSTAFLSLVMIAEPKTSPIFPRQQTVIGIIGGIILFLNTTVWPNIIFEPFTVTILSVNIVTMLFKQKKFLQ